MFGKKSDLKALSLLTTLTVSVIAYLAMLSAVPIARAAATYTGMSKPMEFYLHHFDTPVHVAGLDSKYIMNTTKSFKFLTHDQAYVNSFHKPVGLPKIAVDFYLFPNLAGPVAINGSWQVFIWVNGSAYKPAGFTIDFKEITVGGVTLWDSGPINPTVTSSIGAYIDVPVYNYNLSATLSHTFNTGTTLLTEVEVNAGSSADTRIWYDSPLYPSKVILPAQDYARPSSVRTYSTDNSETTLFHYNWSESQRIVLVRANVTDPFGGYDIYKVNVTIFDPSGTPVVNNTDMVRTSDGQWRINYLHVFEANWSYPINAVLGNYTVIVSVIDSNGFNQFNDTGSFTPFVEEETYRFTLGVVVYYDPVFLITDDVDAPLPNAQVYVTWLNGTKDALPRYTATDGSFNLTQVQTGNYGLTVLWKDKVVRQTIVHVDSNGPYTVKTLVYQLTVQVFGNDGHPIHGAYVIVYTQSGAGYGLDTTNITGRAVFKLPSGTYKIDAHYTSDYWLTVIRSSVTEQVSVTSSGFKNIVLADFPPALTSTVGFWLLLTLIVAAGVVAAFILYIIYKRIPIRKRA